MKIIKTAKSEITIMPLQEKDVSLFSKWLDKGYIYKWFCPNGEEDRKNWLDEVNGKYSFQKHFMVYCNDRKIGYGLYTDCFFLRGLTEAGHDFKHLYGDIAESNHTYEIGYLIGEEEYLNKGIGKIIVQLLEEKIIDIGGKEIASDPDEENTISIKTLLCNGFKKKGNGDYRKKL